MEPDDGTVERIDFLTGSQARLAVLDALLDGPADQPGLREALDLPQSTLARNLGKLREEGWVAETTATELAAAGLGDHADGGDDDGDTDGDGDDGGDGVTAYRLTALGRAVLEDLAPVADRLAVLDRLREYPEAFPLETLSFDLGRLAPATWRTSSATEPYAVVNRVRSVLQDATTIEAVLPQANPVYSDVLALVAGQPGTRVETIVPAARLPDDEAAALDAMGAGDDGSPVSVRAHEGPIDYAMTLVDDDRVLLAGHHNGGMPSLLVETDDDAVRDWAAERFEALHDRSRPVGGGR